VRVGLYREALYWGLTVIYSSNDIHLSRAMLDPSVCSTSTYVRIQSPAHPSSNVLAMQTVSVVTDFILRLAQSN
jgi:hypothetical protein